MSHCFSYAMSVTERSQNKCTQSGRLAVLRGMRHRDGLFTESGLDFLPGSLCLKAAFSKAV